MRVTNKTKKPKSVNLKFTPKPYGRPALANTALSGVDSNLRCLAAERHEKDRPNSEFFGADDEGAITNLPRYLLPGVGPDGV